MDFIAVNFILNGEFSKCELGCEDERWQLLLSSRGYASCKVV